MIKQMTLGELHYNVSQLHLRLHDLALQMELAACEMQEEKLRLANAEFTEQFMLLKEVEAEIKFLNSEKFKANGNLPPTTRTADCHPECSTVSQPPALEQKETPEERTGIEL